MSDFSIFLEQVKRVSPDALLVLYGDHKPALSRFFVSQGILGEESITRIGKNDFDIDLALDPDWSRLGDVPVLLFRFREGKPARDELEPMKSADQMPLYCLLAEIDKVYLVSGNPVVKYVATNSCSDREMAYMKRAHNVPAWVYSGSLFKNN